MLCGASELNLKALNKKEISRITDQIDDDYGCDSSSLADEYVFFVSEKSKIYIINNKIKSVPIDRVRINSLGLYFCELNRGKIRLSMEGCLIIGRIATRNVIDVDPLTAREWLKGSDVPTDIQSDEFVILRHNSDYLGSGKIKEGRILNFVSKPRRVRSD